MRICSRTAGLAALSLIVFLAPTPAERAGVPRERLAQLVERSPMLFEVNKGQAAVNADFLSRGLGYQVAVTATEAVLRLTAGHAPPAALRMRLVGAAASAAGAGERQAPTRSHYYIGDDPARWRTNIPSYERVRYDDVYPGIDLVYYGNQRRLEYDFVVEPGADPTAIEFELLGADSVGLDDRGQIVMGVAGGQMTLQAPTIYQERNGRREPVSGGYVLTPENRVRFVTGSFDRETPLVIDPILTYASYFGGPEDDFANDIALASDGHFYLTGRRPSFFGGDDDLFVARFRPDGAFPLYTTHVGGGSDPLDPSPDLRNARDEGLAIAVDAAGSAYVTGYTRTPRFPDISPISQGIGGAVVVKLRDNGLIDYSLSLGSGRGEDIAVDEQGQAHITGSTDSSGFLVANAFQPTLSEAVGECVTVTPNTSALLTGIPAELLCSDAFVTKLNADASAVVYSTYLGGNDDDGGASITLDQSGNAFVTGVTLSSVTTEVHCSVVPPRMVVLSGVNFPLVNPLVPWLGGFDHASACPPESTPLILHGRAFDPDTFLSKFSPEGELTFSTYLGERGYEGVGAAMDGTGRLYVLGRTGGTGFVKKFTPGSMSEDFSFRLAASSSIVPTGLAVDATGSAWVSGFTGPLSVNAVNDAFVVRLAPDGSRELFTFPFNSFGGEAVRATGIAVNPTEQVGYVSGFTTSTALPIFLDLHPYQINSGGGTDGFVFVVDGHSLEITDGPSATPDVVPTEGSTQLSVSASDSKAHALTYLWSNVALTGAQKCYPFNQGGFSDPTARNPGWTAPANFSGANRICGIRVVVTDSEGFSTIGAVTVTVEPAPNRPPVANADATPTTIEQQSPGGASVMLDGSRSQDPDSDTLTYSWTGPFGTATGVKPTVQLPPGLSTVTLVVNDGTVTSAADSVQITVADTTAPTIVFDRHTPAANGAGWNNTAVTIEWACTDAGSGPLQSTVSRYLTTDGAGQSATGTCTDQAGNTASDTRSGINIDRTPPAIVIAQPANGGSFGLGQAAVASYSCTDALSGVASCAGPVTSGAPLNTATVGASTFTVDATDVAGNPAALTHTYAVRYGFQGFFSPINNLPTTNRGNAGRMYPVKWRLVNAGGAAVGDQAALAQIALIPAACGAAGADVPGEESLLDTSSIHFNPLTGDWHFSWKTQKSQVGCWTLQVRLADGSVHAAAFELR